MLTGNLKNSARLKIIFDHPKRYRSLPPFVVPLDCKPFLPFPPTKDVFKSTTLFPEVDSSILNQNRPYLFVTSLINSWILNVDKTPFWNTEPVSKDKVTSPDPWSLEPLSVHCTARGHSVTRGSWKIDWHYELHQIFLSIYIFSFLAQ